MKELVSMSMTTDQLGREVLDSQVGRWLSVSLTTGCLGR